MISLKVRGFIQIWSRQTGMTKSKEALIETVQRKKETKLVVTFKSGKLTRIFQLSNNIRSVVLIRRKKRKSHLRLTLKNNVFLFIDKLSYKDAKQLNTFLDIIHQNKFQQPTKPDDDWSVLESRDVPKEIDRTSFYICYKPGYGKGGKTPFPQKMPLFMSKSPACVKKGLVESQGGKRKDTLSSDLDMNEHILKEHNLGSNEKYKTDPLKYTQSYGNDPSSLEDSEKGRSLEPGPPFNSSGNPDLDETLLAIQTLEAEHGLTFPLEPEHSRDDPRCHEAQVPPDLLSEQPQQGFPNLGNTCYMNAILQSLFAIPSFADDLLTQDVPWEYIPFEALLMTLTQLLALKDFCSTEIKKELLGNVKKVISAVAEIFSGDLQNDAHEFLGQCLDQLKEDMENLNAILKTGRGRGDGNSSPQLHVGHAATRVFVCPVVANFEFELQLSIICKACGHAVLKVEPNNYLSINLHQETKALPTSIQDSLDLFFREEELEYNCEMCKRKSCVAMHTLSRLSRVLIVHLKRYSFNDAWLLAKNNEQVYIPKYLSLSSYCYEGTKQPLPLSSNAPLGKGEVLDVSREMVSESTSPLTASMKLTSESSDSLVLPMEPDKNSDLQRFQRGLGEASQEQRQRDLENGSTLESKLVNFGDTASGEKKCPVADSLMDQGDLSLPVICEDGGEPISSPDTRLLDFHLQEMPQHPDLEKCENTNTFVELHFDSVTESTDSSYECKENRIPEGSPRMSEQLQQCIEKSIIEELLQQAPPPGVRKPDAQEHTEETLSLPTEARLQKADLNHLGAFGSDNPGDKDILDTENARDKVQELTRNTKVGDPLQAYRLISVVSHIGSSPNSGHYISDAYDFQKQAWFTYNDLCVSEISETEMQEARLHSGYIFFYMHSGIFEELLRKAENSRLLSAQAEVIPQGQ
uniref:Ubiquitin carboxyl-terminal hydrolase n=1 Tax=Callithrix jacchus TaxID=9483 RepID=A0A5F4W426_CALJA|nr:ubiquitin carboxyl-terminal hydrolase 29 [Callithrix jacchus]XP_035141040.2 ubiquitin carboxyl-terminal hydrolase 29 [Callithrix jacchus]XP_035141042.2 ubiquitin carboxyl-terminal hydrolase 29 [Callithrix jacchus]XP_054105406.1 ubiquitin carboxyl-terminal hydrolase 29 [Callithrix jacchus]